MKFVFSRCAASRPAPSISSFSFPFSISSGTPRSRLRCTSSFRARSRFVLQERRRQIEADALVQKLHDLLFLRAFDLVLFFVLEICAQSRGADRPAFFPASIFAANASSSGGRTFSLISVQRHRVIGSSCPPAPATGKSPGNPPGSLRVSPGFMPDHLLAKLRQKIIRREAEPELLSAVQILARFRHDFADRLLRRSLPSKSITAKSSIASARSGHIDEIRRLIAQPFHRGVDFRLGHLRVSGNCDRDILVFGQLEFRRGHHRRAEPHRPIVAKFDVSEIGQAKRPATAFPRSLRDNSSRPASWSARPGFPCGTSSRSPAAALCPADNPGSAHSANSCSRSRPIPCALPPAAVRCCSVATPCG